MSNFSRRAVIAAVGGSAVSWAAISLARSAPWSSGPGAGPVRTSFGSVAVLGSSRTGTGSPHPERLAGASSHPAAHPADHPAAHPGAAGAVDTPVGSAVHGAWTDGVLVDVEVHNRLGRPVELSPGQFRVRVDRDGTTVSLYSADRDAEPLAPGATRAVRISYLAPPPDRTLSLVFDDTGSRRPVDLGPVGRATATGVRS